MKGKNIFRSLVIIALALAIATGCTSYKSIQATALLGKNLDSQSKELASISEICRLSENMNLAYLDCTKESKRQAEYQRIAKVISAYGAQLEKLVGERKELDYATEVSSIINGFTSVEWNKLANDATMQTNLLDPLKKVAALFVDAAVKKELYQTISSTDPYFQDLKQVADLEFTTRRDALKNANSQINAAIFKDSLTCNHPVANPDSPDCTDACDIRLVLGCRDFRSMNRSWDDYTKALFAFIDAHSQLKQGFSANAKDPETYRKVLEAVKGLYQPTKKE
jgi:hypothetical protein